MRFVWPRPPRRRSLVCWQEEFRRGKPRGCRVVLGYSVSDGFFLLSGAVGAGLTFAGVTGFCGMARLLATMPWNRRQGVKTRSR